MTGRRTGNRIRGPHSALTDFLAANNISAQQIRDSYQQRVQQAEAEDPAANDGQDNQDGAEEEDAEAAAEAAAAEAAIERTKKRKRRSEKAVAKVKESKAAAKKKAKKAKKGDDDSDESDGDYDDALENMYKKPKKLPGQLENCETCGKRFTVTPYSKAAPDGGLLCTPCGKLVAKDEKALAGKAKKPVAATKKRRKLESDRLDGLVRNGAKTLVQLCIEKVAQHHNDIEEFGDLPVGLLTRLGEIFGKNRVLNSRTLRLFLQPDLDTLAVHEAAYLETEDYEQIFAVIPRIKKLVLNNACQFKDSSVEYMKEKAGGITWLQLGAANLVSNDMWIKLFEERGANYETLKLTWLDAAFDDAAVAAMAQHCTNLTRLKLERCRQITPTGFEHIIHLPKLQHLTLHLSHEIPSDRLVAMLTTIGHQLQTLSLQRALDADDSFLAALHTTCNRLSKLRFCENDACTDAAYAALFTNWTNPPLRFVDLNSTRDIDNSNPDGPPDTTGLGDAGFQALMTHSGSKLEHLDVSSCRHISLACWLAVFDGRKQYPCLQTLNVNFCGTVDTTVVAGVFGSCPQLRKLETFGCFGVEDVRVPRGIVLVGAPRAQDQIEQFGEGWGAGRVVEVGA
ncbi:RNI-like protein [Pseudovirgaria hyperparasitica]|uniref:RNI-like protein n=1 Tax=Pseudovirgaria hyperparasitica TaxID=470096 RepID=A0A6A6WF12_9PEZI|nr:RNI-like protein [Pseudovirgaria hyperparasitica]KAF2760476.1 RNI-like protein [Pseudovirgaria hyperparasitica]